MGAAGQQGRLLLHPGLGIQGLTAPDFSLHFESHLSLSLCIESLSRHLSAGICAPAPNLVLGVKKALSKSVWNSFQPHQALCSSPSKPGTFTSPWLCPCSSACLKHPPDLSAPSLSTRIHFSLQAPQVLPHLWSLLDSDVSTKLLLMLLRPHSFHSAMYYDCQFSLPLFPKPDW